MTQPDPPEKQWQTILALVLSALGILSALFLALSLGVIGRMSSANAFSDPTGMLTTLPIGLLVWSFILSAILLLPVFLLSLYRLQGKPIPKWLDTDRPEVGRRALWVIVIWPVVVLIGWLVAGRPQTAAYLLGPINILVAGLPVLWIYTVSQRKLKAGSQTRKWRIFGFSLVVTPVVIVFVELMALVGVALAIGLWVAYQGSADAANIERELTYIATQISLAKDLDTVLLLLKPYILQPTVIFVALAVIAGVMPIIEELLKPLAVWALAGKEITPQEGFVAGLLSGAAFALMENLMYATATLTAEDWLFNAIARSGTGVLHMLGSGLVGWGLARAWRDGKWPLLGLNTLIAIGFHGLWNALALVAGVAPLYAFGLEATFWQTLLFYIPLILLFVVAFITLLLSHRRLQKQQEEEDLQTGTILEGEFETNA